jgi:MurNAc alpha-1-phosphate uridylyltransferase
MTRPLMIFAAGLGTRMGTLTAERPKPLIPVAGRPLIDHALEVARGAGAAPVAVNLHWKAAMLRDHLAGTGVRLADESDCLLETGGGLRAALPLLGPEAARGPVWTLNSDAVWTGPNPLRTLGAAWREGMEALLLLVPRERAVGHRGPGDFALLPDGRLARGGALVFTGAQMLRSDGLAAIPEAAFSLNRLWDGMLARGTLFGALHPGGWADVGRPEGIALAEAMLAGAMLAGATAGGTAGGTAP